MLKAKGVSLTSGFVGGEKHAVPCTHFDHEALDRDEREQADATRERLLQLIQAICEWLYPEKCRSATVNLRAYAFIWFMRPNWLGDPTQVELSAKLGVSKQRLGKVVNQLRKRFGFYVAGMRSDAARRKFAVNAKQHAVQLAEARRRANRGRKAAR